MDAVAMIIKTTTQPGRRDEVQALYEELLAPRAKENEHQPVVVWCADQADDDTFFLFELYTDADAMGANASASWFADYLGRVGPLLAGQPEVSMATPRWTKGV